MPRGVGDLFFDAFPLVETDELGAMLNLLFGERRFRRRSERVVRARESHGVLDLTVIEPRSVLRTHVDDDPGFAPENAAIHALAAHRARQVAHVALRRGNGHARLQGLRRVDLAIAPRAFDERFQRALCEERPFANATRVNTSAGMTERMLASRTRMTALFLRRGLDVVSS